MLFDVDTDILQNSSKKFSFSKIVQRLQLY